jgi:glycosyltransferase involved in cell wall biosynthesis
MAFKVLAIIPVYNEADILPGVLRHLHSQGVDTYVIDNWSNDATWELPDRPLATAGYEFFPTHPVHIYQWERILHRAEEVALQFSGQYDWMMLHDADEIRRHWHSKWTLNEGIELVNKAGYNVIDFKVYTFPPVDNGWVPGSDPEAYFTHYRPNSGYDHVPQEKCWKVYPDRKIALAYSGGHRVAYMTPGDDNEGDPVKVKLCPHKFILKHYPIRSQSHGERKVFEERQKRWHLGERGKLWHTQYDGIEPGHNFLANKEDLIEWPTSKTLENP